MGDTSLLERLQQGDENAMKDLYLCFRDRCIAYAQSHLLLAHQQPEEAAELYQDAVLILFENAAKGRLQQFTASPSTYLIAVMKNRFRSQQRKQTWLPLLTDPTPIDQQQELEIQQKVQQVLATMSEKCRELLYYRYSSGLDSEGIAEVTDYKGGATVRNLLTRCRKKFAEIYQNWKEKAE